MTANVAIESRIGESGGDLARILRISVPVCAVLAEQHMSLESILSIAIGTILEFSANADEDLTFYAGNRAIGTGRVVKIGEHFGFRITRIDPLAHRIDALGPTTKS